MNAIDRLHFTSALEKVQWSPLELSAAEVDALTAFGSPPMLKAWAAAAEKVVAVSVPSTPTPPRATPAEKAAADADQIAAAVLQLVQAAIAPVVTRVAALEQPIRDFEPNR